MRRPPGKFRLAALRRKNELFCQVDLWGLVALFIVLLVVFMMAPPRHYLVSADRPTAIHSTTLPRAIREDSLQVTVARDGRVFFRDHPVALEDLPDEIREGVRGGGEKKVYIVADARAKYRDVDAVVDQIRLAGINDIAFLTDTPGNSTTTR